MHSLQGLPSHLLTPQTCPSPSRCPPVYGAPTHLFFFLLKPESGNCHSGSLLHLSLHSAHRPALSPDPAWSWHPYSHCMALPTLKHAVCSRQPCCPHVLPSKRNKTRTNALSSGNPLPPGAGAACPLCAHSPLCTSTAVRVTAPTATATHALPALPVLTHITILQLHIHWWLLCTLGGQGAGPVGDQL